MKLEKRLLWKKQTVHVLGVLAFLIGLASRTTAQTNLLLTLDQPFQTAAVPSSGTYTFVFTGTLSNLSTTTQSVHFALYAPFLTGATATSGTPLTYMNGTQSTGVFATGLPNQLAPGQVFQGTFFTVPIDSTTMPGLYNDNTDVHPLSFQANDESEDYPYRTPYSINVAPEPSAWVALAVGVLVLGVFALRARHRSAT